MRRITQGLGLLVLLVGLLAGAVGGAAAAAEPGPESGMAMGRADAPITIIEYSSLTCPHCAAFHSDTLPDLKKAYIDTGKARLVYRDFPLDRGALKAAMLAHCAGPDRYFGFIEMLFRSQKSWVTASNPDAALARIARLGGIGRDRYEACMNDRALETSVLSERLLGQEKYNITSTPTFIIDGKSYAGTMPFETLDKILRPLLPES